MICNHNDDVLCSLQEILEELYVVDSIIKVTQSYCNYSESEKQFYGLSTQDSTLLSQERNNYANLLKVAQEKVDNIIKLHCSFEEQLLLQKYSNNCC